MVEESFATLDGATTLAWGSLPTRLRALHFTSPRRAAGWLAEAFAVDRAAQVDLEEVQGAAAGLARLRDENFDAVLLEHEPGQLDALELLMALRAAGTQEPLVVLSTGHER